MLIVVLPHQPQHLVHQALPVRWQRARAKFPRPVADPEAVAIGRMRGAPDFSERPVCRIGQIGERVSQRAIEVEQHGADVAFHGGSLPDGVAGCDFFVGVDAWRLLR